VEGRQGLVSFAVIDSRGDAGGIAPRRAYVSASIVKAPLMVAELRRLRAAGGAVDAGTEALLRAMITYSDNDAADSVYATVGDEGLEMVAARTGMRDFGPAGYWSEAWITARDMARFMWGLERRALRPPHRPFALELLARVVPEQRWGIPAAAGQAWRVWFKGGWRAGQSGALVNQAALLRDGLPEGRDRGPHRGPALARVRDRDGARDHVAAARGRAAGGA
jgi:hypothetical protein